jgi:hypothetical protein
MTNLSMHFQARACEREESTKEPDKAKTVISARMHALILN